MIAIIIFVNNIFIYDHLDKRNDGFFFPLLDSSEELLTLVIKKPVKAKRYVFPLIFK